MTKEMRQDLNKNRLMRRYVLGIFEFIYQTLGKFDQKCFAINFRKV
uniref:Uncharacterized protein n=1 Tax=Candidatus Methanophagaceae archaeon ANME-1 ERB6 TaxID=2759912 RepID=A0A7G9YVY8_9EURY|nr:hypothetical protein MDNCFBIC_00043 [Methanosarcinales archaeon ANME-1 ERB6]